VAAGRKRENKCRRGTLFQVLPRDPLVACARLSESLQILPVPRNVNYSPNRWKRAGRSGWSVPPSRWGERPATRGGAESGGTGALLIALAVLKIAEAHSDHRSPPPQWDGLRTRKPSLKGTHLSLSIDAEPQAGSGVTWGLISPENESCAPERRESRRCLSPPHLTSLGGGGRGAVLGGGCRGGFSERLASRTPVLRYLSFPEGRPLGGAQGARAAWRPPENEPSRPSGPSSLRQCATHTAYRGCEDTDCETF